MSAFLGPIHFWLYRKIQLQEELIREIATQAKQQSFGAATGDYSCYVSGELRPLDELIDTMNIHGWLQERIHDAESRYAGLVSEILKRDPGKLEKLRALAFRFGEAHALRADSTAPQAYRGFEDVFLNGMPCDRVNMLKVQEADAVAWEQTQDLHGAFWTEKGLSPDIYYELRTAQMQGMLQQTALHLESTDSRHYEIRGER